MIFTWFLWGAQARGGTFLLAFFWRVSMADFLGIFQSFLRSKFSRNFLENPSNSSKNPPVIYWPYQPSDNKPTNPPPPPYQNPINFNVIYYPTEKFIRSINLTNQKLSRKLTN
jgi:hypothetical protein